MARHSISEAARLTGKARSTLHRHIKSGKLSKATGDDGEPVIDTSELIRAYGPLQQEDSSETRPIGQRATPEKDTRDSALRAEVEALRQEKLDRLEADNEELRRRLDEEVAERRKDAAELRRLTALLVDHRTPPRPWWRRFVGR